LQIQANPSFSLSVLSVFKELLASQTGFLVIQIFAVALWAMGGASGLDGRGHVGRGSFESSVHGNRTMA
jgi:hypothetical protein